MHWWRDGGLCVRTYWLKCWWMIRTYTWFALLLSRFKMSPWNVSQKLEKRGKSEVETCSVITESNGNVCYCLWVNLKAWRLDREAIYSAIVFIAFDFFFFYYFCCCSESLSFNDSLNSFSFFCPAMFWIEWIIYFGSWLSLKQLQYSSLCNSVWKQELSKPWRG